MNFRKATWLKLSLIIILAIAILLPAIPVSAASNSAWAWGYNYYGQLGNGNKTNSLSPVSVSGLSGVTAAAGGENFSLFVKSDGTVYADGWDSYGQIGNGKHGSSYSYTTPVRVSGLSGAISVAAGTIHSLALKNDGSVWAWGENSKGQVGSGTTNSYCASPIQVSGGESGGTYLGGIAAIAAGNSFSLALDRNGNVWGWGDNTYGQLGNGIGGTSIYSTTPVRVLGSADGNTNFTGITAIAAGFSFSMALDSSGNVYTWGCNSDGQLGINSMPTPSSIPVRVLGGASGDLYLTGITAIDCGDSHGLAVKNNDAVYAWGSNGNGKLGNGTTTRSLIPIRVLDSGGTGALSNVKSVQAGTSHSLALKNDGTVWAWGSNFAGQLGLGTSASYSYSPVQVTGSGGSGYLNNIAVIAAGSNHSLAITIPTPTITSFNPASGGDGNTVTITGSGFWGGGSSSVVISVSIGGTAASSYNVTSDTTITALVGAGSSGTISVTTSGGTATSSSAFTYLPTFSVTFDSQGGSTVGNQTVDYGGRAVKPIDPTYAGYDFGGWYKEPGCTNAWLFDTDTISGPTTLYARWTARAYITVVKNVLNSTDTFGFSLSGGNGLSESFSINPTQEKTFVSGAKSEAGYTGSQTLAVDPGTYTITESTLPDGWVLYGSDVLPGSIVLNQAVVEITVAAGETVTVEFYNQKTGGVGWPLPEMPAVALMAIGLLGLGGFFLIRKHKLTSDGKNQM